MSNNVPTYKGQSRKEWLPKGGKNAIDAELQVGCLQRIADALESLVAQGRRQELLGTELRLLRRQIKEVKKSIKVVP